MKIVLSAIICSFVALVLISGSPVSVSTLGKGEQPQISVDPKGVLRVVYGQQDKIYCATSQDEGLSFSTPTLIAQVPYMHLGMSRGPQIASSAHYCIVTAIDKAGEIHCFRLKYGTNKWKNLGTINDQKGSSPEGLMSIAADGNDNFYAVWLDIRTNRNNQIYFSTLSGVSNKWSANALLYQSPDGHVCECCKPSIYAAGDKVAVMFRNWLDGSRDLYVMTSVNKGRNFDKAQKLGAGTWKLNGCPMDGGGLTIDPTGAIETVWQRHGIIYYCQPGRDELQIGKGRSCSITTGIQGPMISMQTGDTLKLIRLPLQKESVVGSGSFLRSTMLPDNSVFCVWEENNAVMFRKVQHSAL